MLWFKNAESLVQLDGIFRTSSMKPTFEFQFASCPLFLTSMKWALVLYHPRSSAEDINFLHQYFSFGFKKQLWKTMQFILFRLPLVGCILVILITVYSGLLYTYLVFVFAAAKEPPDCINNQLRDLSSVSVVLTQSWIPSILLRS